MVGSRGSQGIQYGRGHTSSTTTFSMLSDRRTKLPQSWNKEGFISVDQSFFRCEMTDPSTSNSAQVEFASDTKTKTDREKRKRDYEGQIEEP